MIDGWAQDARFALRLLRKSPLFTATAALSLAIGIGANATIFSVASALLLRPMPGLAEAERLMDIGRNRGNDDFDTVSFPNYKDIAERSRLISIYAHQLEPSPMSLGASGEAERIYGALVSANYFSVLGTRPHLGRLLQPSDDQGIGASPVLVLGHDLWTRRFGSRADIVGQPIQVNGAPFTVVGVAPPGFQGTTIIKGDLWIPLPMLTEAMPDRHADLFTSRGASWLFMGGRLAEGATLEQANAELDAIAVALEKEHPRTNDRLRYRAAGIAVVPGLTKLVAGFIAVLLGIVTLLLLIACANLAGMLLARGAARQREFAVRLAIGASPRRIVRQLLAEALVLFVIGGVAGLLLSKWLSALLLTVLPQLPMPLFVQITVDWRVVAFTAAVSACAALLCGLAPAVQARRMSMAQGMKNDPLQRPGRFRLRSVFVVAQVALSLVLVIVAGLFVRALQHAANTPTGFDVRHVDAISLDLSLARLKPASGRAFAHELLDRTRALPGVTSAALMVDLPLDGGRMGFGGLRLPGLPGSDGKGGIDADWNVISPEAFRTLGMRLVRGRDFDTRDTEAAPPVAIVNEAFARTAWPNAEPVGQVVETNARGRTERFTIVGIAEDARVMSIGERPMPYIYVPFDQLYRSGINLLVKTSGPSVIPEVRRLVQTLNPNLPVTEALPLSEITALGTIPQRIASAISGTLGVVGLLLATMGIFGVTAYAVNVRTREIGIRVALGAANRDVMRLMLRQGVVLAVIGILIGTALAAAAAQVISSLLLGVDGLDPVTFIGSCLVFGIVATVASYVPARRALSVDPMVALRTE